ncbi:hypothetical protein [Streptomyces sp. NBC_01361]|uniref:hypothetical protein n=1 Tax=Streptomyces sp. NBC_01361 TaxID=2903838 RepID=UPI002E354576|nr:hypothetical protein [Streptomyces sp. NBC_01361]
MLPGAVQLAALTVAAHPRPDGTAGADLDPLMHWCGQTPQQLTCLLDQLAGSQLPASWHQEGEVLWQLPGSG